MKTTSGGFSPKRQRTAGWFVLVVSSLTTVVTTFAFPVTNPVQESRRQLQPTRRASSPSFVSFYHNRRRRGHFLDSSTLQQLAAQNYDAKIADPFWVRRAKSDIQVARQKMEGMTTLEMAAMTSAGGVLLVAVVSLLATNMEPPAVEDAPLAAIEEVVGNVVDAALPLTASDVVSVAIGEGLAGLLSAGFTYLIGELRMMAPDMPEMPSNLQQLSIERRKRGMPTFSDAVADGDFLLTQAAATPLLGSFFGPPTTAALALALAVLPSEFIRIDARSRQRRVEEDFKMEELLREEQKKQRKNAPLFVQLQFAASKKGLDSAVDLASLKPVMEESGSGINYVEIFCDITRWLEYQILINDFRGMFEPLSPAMESGLFGAMATLSTLLYADVFYLYFGLGGEELQEKVQQRTFEDWSTIYLTRMFYGAVLFGVYQWAQGPTTELISDLLSGGFDNCMGSDHFQTCIDIYAMDNPPGDSPESQIQTLIRDFYSILDRFRQ